MSDASSIFKSKYSIYTSTLNKTSYDDQNDIHLCQNTTQLVYDFDAIVKDKYPSKQPASPDALLVDKETIYCIEFKNEQYAKINREQIKKKVIDGKEVIQSIFTENNINISHYKFIFCVAYKANQGKYKQERYKRFGKKPIQFGLRHFIGSAFNEIQTNDIQFFIHEYKKRFKKKLIC